MLKPLSLLCLSIALLQGCSSGSDGDDEGPEGTVSVSGTITGLSGALTLSINGNQETLDTNGDFNASNRVNEDENYQISVVSTEQNLSCTVTNGAGLATGNITDVVIECNGTDFTAYNLNALAFNVQEPSVITFAFHLIDRYSNVALDNLTGDTITDYLELLENGMPISPSESFLELDKFDQFNAQYTTVFAIDVSSSLNSDDLEAVVSAISNLIVDPISNESKLKANQKISIITFDSQVTTLVQNEQDPAVILQALSQVKVGGNSTNLFGALSAGGAMWENDISLELVSYGSLILFTDGNDTSGSTSKSDALSATAEKDVFFITVGTETDPTVLEEFTQSNNIFSLDSFAQLEQKLDAAIAQVETFEDGLYILSYATPKRAGEHTLTIKAIDDYRCDTAVTEEEMEQVSNTGQISDCDDAKDFEFNADGFADVMATLDVIGSTVTLSPEVEWQTKLRWSRDQPDIDWQVDICTGDLATQLSDDKGTMTFSRTSSELTIALVHVSDNVTATTVSKNLVLATDSQDLLNIGDISTNFCSF